MAGSSRNEAHPVADSLTDLEGRRGRPFRMAVEEGKCREFARATTPRSRPHDIDPELAPITFLASVRLWIPPEDSAWYGVERDYRRVLHGEQEFVLVDGPVRIGTELTVVERIDRVYEKHGSRGQMVFTETVTDFADVDRAVASLRATTITLPPPLPDGGRAAASGGTGLQPPPEGRHELGELTDSPLTVTDFVRYQGASGDFNPIHHDSAFAEGAGYPGPFAVGMLTAGYVAALLGEYADPRTLRRYTTRWMAQAWPGDALTYRFFEDDDERFRDPALRTLGAEVLRPNGQLHMRAWAQFATS
jgi:acyl dehydratase